MVLHSCFKMKKGHYSQLCSVLFPVTCFASKDTFINQKTACALIFLLFFPPKPLARPVCWMFIVSNMSKRHGPILTALRLIRTATCLGHDYLSYYPSTPLPHHPSPHLPTIFLPRKIQIFFKIAVLLQSKCTSKNVCLFD